MLYLGVRRVNALLLAFVRRDVWCVRQTARSSDEVISV